LASPFIILFNFALNDSFSIPPYSRSFLARRTKPLYDGLTTPLRLAAANRRFNLDKRTQLFIGANNETFSVAAMCVNNEDRLPVQILG